MQTIDAIFTGGKFEPIGPVDLAENERVWLTVESQKPKMSWEEWSALALAHQERLRVAHGVLPDSTPDIAADRLRDA